VVVHLPVHSRKVTLMRYSKLVYCLDLPEIERKIAEWGWLGSRLRRKGSAFFGWQLKNLARGGRAGDPKLRDRRL
jgi:hypothetical protein